MVAASDRRSRGLQLAFIIGLGFITPRRWFRIMDRVAHRLRGAQPSGFVSGRFSLPDMKRPRIIAHVGYRLRVS